MLSSIVFLGLVLGIVPALGGGSAVPAKAKPKPAKLEYIKIDFSDATISSSRTQADGINNHRQIVGLFREDKAPFKQHGFLLAAGSFTKIDVKDAMRTAALGINNHHDIVGLFQDANLVTHGFLLANGKFTTIDAGPPPPPSFSLAPVRVVETIARGVRVGHGPDEAAPVPDIVGWFQDLTPPLIHGFLDVRGKVCAIDVPGAIRTKASGINSRRHIVGFFKDTPLTTHGFLLVAHPTDPCKGKFFTIDVPGAIRTVARGINSRDAVVGFFKDTPTTTHGFLLVKGAFFTVDFPGAIRTVASGINSRGDIVGLFTDANHKTHGFVATPHHPEPPDEGGD
jgi:probable HAF family extracellular repeat protein